MIILQPPRISGSEKQQLMQIRDYFGVLIPQLNMALKVTQQAEERTMQSIAASPQQQKAMQEEAARATFADVKNLIIKSADIVNAYSEKISLQLEGRYLAKSEFGTYKEETALLLEANSQRVDLLFENDQQITTDLTYLTNDLGGVKGDVQTVQGDVQSVQESMGGLQENVSGLQDNVDAFGEDLAGVRLDTDTLLADTEQLETDLSTVQAATNDLRTTSSSLSADMETVKAQGQTMADSIAGLESTAAGLETDTAALKSATDQIGEQLEGVVADNLLTKAYIRMGLLGTEDGLDIYGLEIGQNVEANGAEIFAKFMRLSAGQLTFYNGDGSVAAVASGDRFLCPVLEAQKLYLGGFSFLPRTNGNLSVRWTQ